MCRESVIQCMYIQQQLIRVTPVQLVPVWMFFYLAPHMVFTCMLRSSYTRTCMLRSLYSPHTLFTCMLRSLYARTCMLRSSYTLYMSSYTLYMHVMLLVYPLHVTLLVLVHACYAPCMLIHACYTPCMLIHACYTPFMLVHACYTPCMLIHACYAPFMLVHACYAPCMLIHACYTPRIPFTCPRILFTCMLRSSYTLYMHVTLLVCSYMHVTLLVYSLHACYAPHILFEAWCIILHVILFLHAHHCSPYVHVPGY
jgi:hypothetical protein